MQTNSYQTLNLQNLEPPFSKFLKELPQSVAIRFALGPFVEIYESYVDLQKHSRLRMRNIINIAFIIICIVVGGIILPIISKPYMVFLEKVLPLVNTTGQSHSFFAYYLGGWIIAYPGSWISKSAINIYSKFKYGDQYYFLTEGRLQILSKSNVTPVADPRERLQEIFNHVRARLRNHAFAPGAQSEDLKQVLDVFMNGEASEALLEYRKQKLLYKFYRWEQGDTEDIFNTDKISSVARIYNESSEEVRRVLQHCVNGLKKHSTEIGATPADYIRTIFNILEETEEGLECFYQQQRIILGLRILRETELKKNKDLLFQLSELQKKRISPRNIDNDDGARAMAKANAKAQRDLEKGYTAEEEESEIGQLNKLIRRASPATENSYAYIRRSKTEEQVDIAKDLLRENAQRIGIEDPNEAENLTDEKLERLLGLYKLRVRKIEDALRSLPEASPESLVRSLEQPFETGTQPSRTSPHGSLGSLETTPNLLFRRLEAATQQQETQTFIPQGPVSRKINAVNASRAQTVLSNLQEAEQGVQMTKINKQAP